MFMHQTFYSPMYARYNSGGPGINLTSYLSFAYITAINNLRTIHLAKSILLDNGPSA